MGTNNSLVELSLDYRPQIAMHGEVPLALVLGPPVSTLKEQELST